jgi:hypothetical protein
MIRKLFVISGDVNFTEQIKAMSVMLTKLNYFIDLKIINPADNTLPDGDVFYVICDLDSGKGIDAIKEFRNITYLKAVKIIAVYSPYNADLKETTFKSGCDAVMTKEEFISVFDSLMR